MRWMILLLVLVAGCAVQQETVVDDMDKIETMDSTPEATPKGDAIFTLDEIGQHISQGDCWLLIDGKVYDVSDYSSHPGGPALLEGCGTDATDLYETRPMGSGTPHSSNARQYLETYYIGDLN